MSKSNIWKLGLEEFGTQHFSVNNKGHLTIHCGITHDVCELAKKYGTPLEILVPEVITKRAGGLRRCFQDAIAAQKYSGTYTHCYPLKVNASANVVKAALAGGTSLEVGTNREAYIADNLYRSGKLPKDSAIVCNGAKEPEYLRTILNLQKDGYNIMPIIEAEQEYFVIKEIIAKLGLKKARVGMRIRIGIEIPSAHFNFASVQNAFGILKPDAKKLIEDYILEDKNIKLEVLHCSVGSQIEVFEGLMSAIDTMAEFYVELKKLGAEDLKYINVGGGLPTAYDKSKPLFKIEDYANKTVACLKSKCDAADVKHPNIMVEHGRWTIAPAQITIFGTHYTKYVVDGLRFIKIDGSIITDLPDVWAVAQNFWFVPVTGADLPADSDFWLSGMTCDSDDVYPPKDHTGLPINDLPRIKLPNVDGLCRLKGTGEKLFITALDTCAYQDTLSGFGGVKHCMLPEAQKIKILPNGKIEVIFERPTIQETAEKIGWKF